MGQKSWGNVFFGAKFLGQGSPGIPVELQGTFFWGKNLGARSFLGQMPGGKVFFGAKLWRQSIPGIPVERQGTFFWGKTMEARSFSGKISGGNVSGLMNQPEKIRQA